MAFNFYYICNMKNYTPSQISRIITSLERFCKVFHVRLDSNSYHTFSNEVTMVKNTLDSILSNDFLKQLNVSQRLIAFSLIYKVYKNLNETSLYPEITYFKSLLDSLRNYILEFDKSDLSNDEIEKLKLCV